MPLMLLVRSSDAETALALTFDSPRIVIGRGESSDMRLPDPSVSHRHASVRQRGSEYIVLDEGSTNGTFVGPVRLAPGAARVLANGDFIKVGRIVLEARLTINPATPQAALATKEVALRLAAETLRAQGEEAAPKVRISAGPDAGKALLLHDFDRAYVLGRSSEADLPLADKDASRRHTTVTRKGDQLWLTDQGSKNGSSLNGVRLEPTRTTPWPRGQELTIGGTQLSYEDPVLDALEELERAPDETLAAQEAPGRAPAAAAGSGASPSRRPATSAASMRPTAAAFAGGWTLSDWLVLLLGLLVLSVSGIGLYWLFNSR